MSRRYGRNQKRRAREEIARLHDVVEQKSEALTMQTELARHIRERKDEIQAEIDTAKDMLVTGCVLLEPASMEIGGPVRDQVIVPLMPPMPSLSQLMSCAMPMEAVIHTMPLDVLLTQAVVDQYADALHFHVKFAEGRWSYAISRRAIDGMTRQQLAKRLSRELAHKMADDMKGIVR